jgi:TctA family transporter
MNFFGALLTVVAVVLGIALLLPVVGFALAILFTLGGVVLWLLPILIIAASDQTSTSEKLLWILAIVFLSWFAWIIYFFFAPVFDRPGRYRHY